MYKIENLKKIRQMMIDNQEVIKPRFQMAYWCFDIYDNNYNMIQEIKYAGQECGTSMCIGGWCAYYGLLDETHSEFMPHAIIEFVTDNDCNSWGAECAYLFDPEHDNDFDDAIARLDYAIEHNSYDANHEIFELY